jgi:methionyl aminopeptidase
MIVKTEEERAILREGGRRLAVLLRELAEMVRPGLSSQALEDRTREIIAAGGDKAAFLNYTPYGAPRPYPAALCLSINDVIVHGIPNENPVTIQDGDVITIDSGLIHKGLYTDSAITVIAGKPDPADIELIAAANEALDDAIELAVAGNTIGHLGFAAEQVAKKYKYGNPRELGGHAVGRAVHEEPFIPNWGHPGEGPKLVEGMVLAIEPMYCRGSGRVKLSKDGYTYRTVDGSRTAHVEHTVIITTGKAEILTLP